MNLDIRTIKKREYVYVIELKGSLDTQTHQQLEEELSELLNEQTKAIILDMKELEYISSIGIKVILSAKNSLKKMNATFTMVNPQPQIKKVLDAMKILPVIDIFDDMPEADKYIDQIINDELKKQAT